MRKIFVILSLLSASPAFAGECYSVDEPGLDYYARYVAPPESRYAGGILEFYGNHRVLIDMEDGGVTPGQCDSGTCYYDETTGEHLFTVAFRDAYSAVIWYAGDDTHLWPAACE